MAAAATIFAACSETDLVNPVYEAQNEIGFENHVGKTTRAEITSEAALAKEGGFVVWGWKTPTAETLDWSTTTQIFNEVNVYDASTELGEKGDATVWTYANKKYWDKTSTYNFYAAAPVDPEHGAYSCTDAATGMITITGVQSALAADSDDFLIDRDGVTEVDGDGTHEKVGFEFNHVMAKVTLKLVCGALNEGDKITVTKLTMTGWDNGIGKFVQEFNETPEATDNIDEWTIDGDTEFKAEYTGSFELGADATAETCVLTSYIMVPQAIAASTLKFTVDFTITYGAGGSENFIGHEGTLATAQTWGTDTHTTYTIKVGPQPIEFDVTSVNGFTNKYPGTDNPNAGDLPIE